MKFYYKKINAIFRPIIPITLISSNRNITTEALVDSGADVCAFDYEIGEALGVKVNKGNKSLLFGITGVGEDMYYHNLTISVGGHEIREEVAFLGKPHGYSHGFLGQRGFFDKFMVKFDYSKYEIEVKPFMENLSLKN